MKTLKKSLCLILALVFVLSLCTVGAGAFSDDADIKYDDAVGIMAELGILEGPEGVDGPFNPKDVVTRAQAAKMIAYMMLGKDNAERMPATGSFSDVKAGDWYAKYVGYCAKQGIINGKVDAEGNKYFDPDAPVTGTELAKMILCALGYGKADEYVGSGWDFNAVADALTNGIYDNSEAADFAVQATREECALYVFNALTACDIVSYKDGVYPPSAETFGEKIWKLQNKTGVVLSMKATGNAAGTSIAMDKVAGDEFDDGKVYTFNTDELEGIDEALIGHKVRVLFKGTIDKIEKVYAMTDISTKVAKKADASAYSRPEGKKVYKIADYSCTEDTATVLVDATSKKAKETLIVCGNDIISFEGGNTYEIAQVSVATDGKISIKNNKTYTDATPALDSWIIDGTFADKDFVKVENIGDKVKLSATEKVEDVLITSKTAGTSPKYNGVYTVSDHAGNINPAEAANALTVGSTYTLYMIDNEVFAAATISNAPTAYDIVYFVMGYHKDEIKDFELPADEYGISEKVTIPEQNKIQFIDAEGEIHYVESSKNYKDGTDKLLPGLYKATYADGKYTLEKVPAPTQPTDPKTAEFTGAKVFVNAEKIPGYSWFIDENTNVIILGKANPDGEAKASNLTVTVSQPGKLNGDYSVQNLYLSLAPISGTSSYTVDAIWITGAAAEGPAEVAGSYMFVTSTTASGQTLLNDKVEDTYSVYIDGEKADVVLTGTNPLSNGAGFYTYTNNGDGTYTVADKLTDTGYKEFDVGGASSVTLYNGILSDTLSASGLDGLNISALSVVDTRSTAKIKSVADLNALKSTDDAVTITFVFGGFPAGPVGVIYVK